MSAEFSIGSLRIRRVQLHGGPCDGQPSMASHYTAISDGHVYVWDGGEDKDRFGYLHDVLAQVPEAERAVEKEKMGKWMDGLLARKVDVVPNLPAHRINAWVQVFQNGLEV